MAGSLEKRGLRSWRLIYSDKGPTGRVKKTKTITVEQTCEKTSCKGCAKISRCKIRGEVEKQLALFVDAIEKGAFICPAKLTFSDFVERWLRDYAEPNLEPKTVHGYKEKLTRILEAMGHLRLEEIRPNHLLEFYANLQEDGVRKDGKPGGLSPNNIRHHHRVISSILQSAIQWQVIATNPAARVKPPRVPKYQARCYDEQEVTAMLAALENEPLKYRVAVVLALDTGVREGELMGFEWDDVDFTIGTVRIKQASQYLPGEGTFTKKPKTEMSEDILAVSPSVMAMLKQYKAHQAQERLKAGDLWQGSDRLFTTWDGRPMHPYTVGSWFPKFLKRHGLPHLNFHGLRHTSATLLINAGAPVKTVSGRLRHAKIGTTMDIYGHYLKSADRDAADRLEQVFQRMKGNEKTKAQSK
ncbi:site-specific integrase [Desulfoscipio sp. XC116]|uniref:site-specific integrase n=1 Tax=Desulfoscipio sp. XC116 TaxID=3144975 RepID=UPI00325C0E59